LSMRDEFLKFIAQNIGQKYPVLSTISVGIMCGLLGGFIWYWLIQFATRQADSQFGPPTPPPVIIHQGDVNDGACSNQAAVDHSSVNCSVQEKKDAQPSKHR
jgi:hypothetical protein